MHIIYVYTHIYVYICTCTEGVVALRELRRALANDNELIIQHALDAGIIEIVLTVLQGTCVDSQVSFVGLF